MKISLKLGACLLGLLFSSSTLAGPFTLINGGTNQSVDQLISAQTASDYYDYGFSGASGNPGFGPEEDTAFFWLYEDSNTGVLSLGMIFDKRCTTSCGSGGTMNLTTSGMPFGTTTSVEDDPGDISGLVNTTQGWWWNQFNTDGGMVSGLEGSSWTIDIDINSYSGLDNFYFLSGNDATNPSSILLDASETIRITTASVPEPGILILMLSGLAGLFYRRKIRA